MWGLVMSMEDQERLTRVLGTPDFRLREIVREQRLMEAASRWPILRDVAPDYVPPKRPINVNLSVSAPAEPSTSIVRLQSKRSAAPVEAEAGKEEAKGQLSNVFLRLKHKEKKKSDRGDKIVAV